MKYGIIEFTPIKSRTDVKFINIGDQIQSDAVKYIYGKMGISEEDIIHININDINNYDGEYIVLPININLSANWIINIFPLPPKVIPVFLGLSFFAAENLSAELVNYFKNFAPVGCRDEATLNLMRKNGIPAYLLGCITLLLPKRKHQPEKGKIFLVDVPEKLKDFIPSSILEADNSVSLSHIYNCYQETDNTKLSMLGYNYLETYKKEAELVITSRVHCVAPCLALGIPVIATVENCSPRFGGIDKFIKIYSEDSYASIDWNPDSLDYEEEKELMLLNVINMIKSTYAKYSMICDVSYMFENRNKSIYGDLYKRRLKSLPKVRQQNLKFAIWGTGQIGMNAYEIIKNEYPESELVLAIDSFCEGTFFGQVIQRPEVLLKSLDLYVFIATYSGEKQVKEYLEEQGKREYVDYLSFATKTG